eukprot:1819151-Rhodomonas_salina.2
MRNPLFSIRARWQRTCGCHPGRVSAAARDESCWLRRGLRDASTPSPSLRCSLPSSDAVCLALDPRCAAEEEEEESEEEEVEQQQQHGAAGYRPRRG